MSMIMSLAALSGALTDAIKERPDRTFELIRDPALDQQMANNGFAIERILPETPDALLSLEKDWHLIHFTLTGQTDSGELPLGFLMAGSEIGENFGYGPARLLEAPQVAEVEAALEQFDIAVATNSLTLERLRQARVYGAPHDMPVSEIVDTYILPAYAELRQFVSLAAGAGNAVFISID